MNRKTSIIGEATAERMNNWPTAQITIKNQPAVETLGYAHTIKKVLFDNT
jgi:hypothetical protein